MLWIDILLKTPAKGGKFTFKKSEGKIPAAYFSRPYPLGVIVCTNGEARYINLGQIPKPTKVVIGHLIGGLLRYQLPTGS